MSCLNLFCLIDITNKIKNKKVSFIDIKNIYNNNNNI